MQLSHDGAYHYPRSCSIKTLTISTKVIIIRVGQVLLKSRDQIRFSIELLVGGDCQLLVVGDCQLRNSLLLNRPCRSTTGAQSGQCRTLQDIAEQCMALQGKHESTRKVDVE